jgi:Tfp pilus assembly PilM family ATPase/Tfp pilus assembly protein PilN
MALLLALEWDSNEARVAVGRTRGREVVIEDAFTVDLEPRDPGQTFHAPHVGARVAAELTARNIGRVETLVAVGRKDIELRLLSVPPAPPEELPDVVRFQAMRQFSSLGEDWPLDFIPLVAGDETPTSVLAATLSPEHVKQIRATCEVGQLTPRRMVLRPMAAASLLSHQLPDAQRRCRLMVDLLSDEVDLTVLEGERVVFLRTCRLPHDSDPTVQNTALAGEIRRTMVAAQNQLGGRRVEYIIVCGNPSDHAPLVEKLSRDLSLPVECFDPFAALAMTDDLRRRLPDRHGRFAPLLGMLVDEAAGTPHAIDFLNPRKRPPPPNRRRQHVMLASAAALVVAAIGGYIWYSFASLDWQIAATTKELATTQKTLEKWQEKIKHAEEIEKFTHGDINWLDELYRLSEAKYFPSAEEAIITQLYAGSREPQGGTLGLEGLVTEPGVINRMENSLRGDDNRHAVSGTGTTSDGRDKHYRWTFRESVMITHPDVAPAAGPAKAAQGKPAAASTKGTPQMKSPAATKKAGGAS